MKLILTSLLVGFGSALLPFINIEAYLGGIGVANLGGDLVTVTVVSLVTAVGQTAGKVVLYYAADRVMALPWMRRRMSGPKWTAAYERWQTRIAEHPAQTTLLLLASSGLGFPPLLVIAVLAGHLRVNIWLFVTTCLVGRWVRFLVILGAADWLVGLL